MIRRPDTKEAATRGICFDAVCCGVAAASRGARLSTAMRRSLYFRPLALALAFMLLRIPLPPPIGLVQPAFAGVDSCSPSPDRILDSCVNGVPSPTLMQFEQDTVNDWLKAHKMPLSNADLIYEHGRIDLRSVIRAAMFARILIIIHKSSLGADTRASSTSSSGSGSWSKTRRWASSSTPSTSATAGRTIPATGSPIRRSPRPMGSTIPAVRFCSGRAFGTVYDAAPGTRKVLLSDRRVQGVVRFRDRRIARRPGGPGLDVRKLRPGDARPLPGRRRHHWSRCFRLVAIGAVHAAHRHARERRRAPLLISSLGGRRGGGCDHRSWSLRLSSASSLSSSSSRDRRPSTSSPSWTRCSPTPRRGSRTSPRSPRPRRAWPS